LSADRKKQGKSPRRAPEVKLRRCTTGDGWELAHPRCALERREDLEEVEAMITGGETEIAIDELRWLLDGCHGCIAAHRMLGELALAGGDTKLARAHFGYAFELGAAAIRTARLPVRLPYDRPANQPFLEAAKGLAHCLCELGRPKKAADVLRQLLACDASDPLGVRAWLEQLTNDTDRSA